MSWQRDVWMFRRVMGHKYLSGCKSKPLYQQPVWMLWIWEARLANKHSVGLDTVCCLSVYFFFFLPNSPSCPFHTFAITSLLKTSKHFSLHDRLSLHLHPHAPPVIHHTLRHINICMINEWSWAGFFFFFFNSPLLRFSLYKCLIKTINHGSDGLSVPARHSSGSAIGVWPHLHLVPGDVIRRQCVKKFMKFPLAQQLNTKLTEKIYLVTTKSSWNIRYVYYLAQYKTICHICSSV